MPLLLAAALHALALVMLSSGWDPSEQASRAIKPHIVRSTLLMLEPKARLAKKTPLKVVQRVAPEPEPDIMPVEIQVEPKPDLDAQRLREQADQAQRQKLLEALAQSSFLDALEIEATDL
ncbi:MAG: hypothetical protein O7B25_14865, partial [Gammaproteobacteria bacterium]|nr:hypothetical protein [Gammaproteobacteria bacterium]